jgi:hypothetical protein
MALAGDHPFDSLVCAVSPAECEHSRLCVIVAQTVGGPFLPTIPGQQIHDDPGRPLAVTPS